MLPEANQLQKSGQRIEQTLLELAEPFSGQGVEIAVFSHDFALRCLRVRLEDDPSLIRVKVDYCSETTIRAQDGTLTLMQVAAPMITV